MRLLLPAALLTPLTLGSCGLMTPLNCVSGYVRPDSAALTRDLQVAQARWQSAGKANYTYTVQDTSFAMTGPVTVTVRAGRVTATTPAGSYGSQGTVEDMFRSITGAIGGIQTTDCYTVSASYDPVDGHPLEVSVAILQKNLADGFGGFRITAFSTQL